MSAMEVGLYESMKLAYLLIFMSPDFPSKEAVGRRGGAVVISFQSKRKLQIGFEKKRHIYQY